MVDGRVPRKEAFGWEGAEELTALSGGELRARLEALNGRGAVSSRRGARAGRMDVIRAELVRRDVVVLTPEKPARVLLGEPAEGGGP